MSEFERYMTRSREEIDCSVSLALEFVGEPEPGIEIDGSVNMTQEYLWRTVDETGITFKRVMLVDQADPTDVNKLVAMSVHQDFSANTITSYVYTLVRDNGRFIVESDTGHPKELTAQHLEDFANPHTYKERQNLLFDMGLSAPTEQEWDNFQTILRDSKTYFEAEQAAAALLAEKAQRGNRLAGFLRRLRGNSN